MIEFAVVIILVAVNGAFSLSELAIVSARRIRLKRLADEGRRGAAAALALAEDPGRFLSTVQIGITLVGVLAGAFSGAALGERLRDILLAQGYSPAVADSVGYGVVIGLITYLSVVVGELLPKNLALRNPEAIACRVAPSMSAISQIAAPLVWLLDASTRLLFWIFGQTGEPESAVTDEEIKTLVAEAQTAGAIEAHEEQMISAVLRLGDRTARALMTPRTEVEWLDLESADLEIQEKLIATTHSRLPVGEASPDRLIGVVQKRDLLAPLLSGKAVNVRAHLRQAPVVPDTMDALDVLAVLRKAETPMALVYDEHGHFEGLVTPADILDAIAGSFRSDKGQAEPEAVRRADGSWLLAGWMPVDEMADQLGLALPQDRNYETVAGLVIDELNHLPELGEAVEALGWRFEIVDLDGRRVDKVLASKIGVDA